MDEMIDFYKRTWWLWLIFVVTFAILGAKVTFLFFIFIPGLLAYSVYFGAVRISEEREREAKEEARLERETRDAATPPPAV